VCIRTSTDVTLVGSNRVERISPHVFETLHQTAI
jgi:hypothetical protein